MQRARDIAKMFNLFGQNDKKPLKGYKITTVDRKQKFGIAADSLKMLIKKSSDKLKIDDCRVYLAKDGTEVQDEAYFQTIEPQTLFVITSASTVVKTDFQLMYEAIRNAQTNIFSTADAIRNFVAENRSEFDKFVCEMQTATQASIDCTQASHRDLHTEWFDGLPTNVTTKEEVMARRSQDRIRGYFYKVKEEFQKSEIYRTNNRGRKILDEMLDIFQHFLVGVDHFSALFNRKWKHRHKSVDPIGAAGDDVDGTKAPPRKRFKVAAIRNVLDETNLKRDYYVSLCNELGEFRCHGIWNSDSCQYGNHSINPYASRENVILFQVWNLDHQIEITRTVIPNILADVRRIVMDRSHCTRHKRPAKMLSIIKYFLELFTMDNLRLVHIVCHDKGTHDLKSKGTILCEKCKEYKALERIWNKIRKSQLER